MYIGASICVFLLRMWKISTKPKMPTQENASVGDSKEATIMSIEESRRGFSMKQWMKANKV